MCVHFFKKLYFPLTQDDCRSLYELRFPAPSERAAAFAAILMKGSALLVKSAFSSCCVTEHR